jgi:HlyD family secretion protein
MNRIRVHFGLLVLLMVTVASCSDQTREATGTINATGFVEGRSFTVISLYGGTVEAVLVGQGDEVTKDQELLSLDDTVFEHVLNQAQAGVDGAQAGLNVLVEQPQERDIDEAEAMLAVAKAELDAAVASVELLESTYSPIDPPDDELHTVEAAVAIAEAGVELASANLNQIKAGPLDGEIRMAEASLREARAHLRLVERQMEEFSLLSPTDGIVAELLVRVGEIVAPGAPIARILDPTYITVKVYVPEQQVALLKVGVSVKITADAYPDETFEGSLSRISDQAQFTPTLVLTEEERVKLVFEVEILIDSGIGKIKPGMPVDVEINL